MKTVLALASAALISVAALTGTYAAQDTSSPAGPPNPTVAQGDLGPGVDCPGFGRGGRGHGLNRADFVERLGLTPDQKAQFKALYVAHQDKTRKLRTDLISIRDEKRTMVLSGKIDQQKLAQLDDQIVKVQSDLMRERLKFQRDRLGLLTPEQIDKMGQMRMERGFHGMKRMHGMHGMHHGKSGIHRF